MLYDAAIVFCFNFVSIYFHSVYILMALNFPLLLKYKGTDSSTTNMLFAIRFFVVILFSASFDEPNYIFLYSY